MARSLTCEDVALVAHRVGGVGEQRAVGADRHAADGVEVVALGERVVVEQHLLAGQRGLVGAGVLVGTGGVQSASSATATRQDAPYSRPSKERP